MRSFTWTGLVLTAALLLVGAYFTFTAVQGPYGLFQRIQIEEPRFGIEPEVTAKVARMRLRIFEVGVSYNGRTYGEGKKIGWKDGVRCLYAILKYNLIKKRGKSPTPSASAGSPLTRD